MMKKIIQATLELFARNAFGWILVFVNFTIIYFLIWVTSDVFHTQMPSNGKPLKTTIFSSYKVNGIALADFVMLVTMMLNSPALIVSNLFYQTFLASPAENLSVVDKSCTYCWFYLSQIGSDVLFIIVQWLVIGLIIKKLFKLVKDS